MQKFGYWLFESWGRLPLGMMLCGFGIFLIYVGVMFWNAHLNDI